MKPTIGRIVHYRLNSAEAYQIMQDRLAYKRPGNPLYVGQVYPAIIVRVWGEQEDALVNLQVFLDGEDSLWASSRGQGELDGQWVWPPRETHGLENLEFGKK